MGYRIALIFALLATTFSVYSQQFSVKGKVLSDGNNGMAYVNILLLKATDSTTVSGTSTIENGVFEFNTVEQGEYILKTSYLGFESFAKQITVAANTALENIVLKEEVESLDGVTINFQKPTLEKKVDRLVFNVENTSLSQTTTFDILKRTPGVLVINDRISIKNSPTTIYINDRRVHLSTSELKSLLESFSGTNVKSVEVITNPPARYDAEGGAVLNIITSKNLSVGYKGSINGNYTQAVYPKYIVGTEHYYKTNVLNLFAGYSYNPRKEFKHDDSYINFFDGNAPDDRWETNFRRTTRSYAHNVNTILDFTLNERNTLSLTANAFYSPGKTYDNNVDTQIFDVSGSLDSFLITESELENDNSNLAFNADYGLKIGNKGAQLNVVGNYIYYDDDQFQAVNTDYHNADGTFSSNNNFSSLAKQKNNIFTGQVDISTPLGSANFETGIKYSSINSESSVDFGGPFSPNQAIDDAFEYDEGIYAAYSSFTKDWDKWGTSMGLRGEYTDVEANSIALGEVNAQQYFELFPTVSLQHTPNDNHTYGISYKRAIERPRYQSLNPYRYFLNENQFKTGNPTLGPSIENKITLSYTYKQRFIFELYYQHINNDLKQLTFQDNQNRVIRAAEFNIDEDLQYSLDFIYYGYIKDWWYLSTYMSGFYLENSFMAEESGKVMEGNNTLGYLGQLFNQFTLSKDKTFTSDVTLQYLSDFIFGSFDLKNQFSANISFRKTLWGNRADIMLDFTDVFNTNNIPLYSRYRNQDNGYFAKSESRSASIGFRYKFGNFKLRDNKRVTKPAEQERLEEKKAF